MPNTDKPPIRLLHLSDIHFRAGKAWDSDPVLRALAKFIGGEVKAGLAPDLVAITGDIAYAGLAEEYALAKDWLERQLWPALPEGFPRDRLLLVPGNHDVDRNQVKRPARLLQTDLLNGLSQDAIAESLQDADERDILLKRHAAYLAFLSEWLGEPQTLPWWRREITFGETRLHIAGLDSAWMAWQEKDRGNLLLGRWQLNQTVVVAEAEAAHWRIALLHHPFDYLAEFDGEECWSTVQLHCDLLLRGHLHKPKAIRVQQPDPDRACLEIAAGCVYDHGTFPNAFQWIELHEKPRKVSVQYRIWIEGKWTIDRNQPGCPDGIAEFPLKTKLDESSKPPKPQVPTEYLAWLGREYANVELLGQNVQQGRAVSLSHVYVPAVTQPVKADRTSEQAAPTQEEQRPDLLLRRLDQSSLYCPAPPGGGKSTFCRWAALQSIPGIANAHALPAPDGYQEPVPYSLRGKLPVLVPLREFWRAMDCGHGRRVWHQAEWEQALAAWVDRLVLPGLDGALLRAHLRAGGVFLLLDGLDEVPESEARDGTTLYPRALLLSGLAAALPEWEKAGNRTLLTSRPYGLDEAGLARLGLPRAPLEPLPEALQTLFVRRWFHTLDKSELAEKLLGVLKARADLAPLAENPMLLTALCVIYENGGNLPEDRYHLYQRIVDNVLINRYPGDIRQREPVKARLEAIAFGMHRGEQESPRSTPAAEIRVAEVDRWLRDFAQRNSAYETERVQPPCQREELLTRSGLLLPRPGESAAFYHLSLQEFLAAEHIAHSSDDSTALENVFRERGGVPAWRPTLLFLFAGQIFNYRNAQWGLNLLESLAAGHDRAAVKANPAMALFLAEALELCLAKYQVGDALAESFRRWCLDAIEDEIEIQARHSLGLCLGKLGDPRVKDLRDPAAYVDIPADDYPYGDGKEKSRIDQAFRLSRYPVTNSQYRAFIDAGGYRERGFWSDDGWAWLQKEGVAEPRLWQDRRFNGPNQPVVGVSFWEAEACCRWAGGRLPTEQAWEAAARGPEGFEFPWGKQWADGICNTWEAGLRQTSAVGLFPGSRQARFGLDDMAGNVWEWCDSYYDGTGESVRRVARGGSWDFNRGFARAACRSDYRPGYRSGRVGFRVLCVAPIP